MNRRKFLQTLAIGGLIPLGGQAWALASNERLAGSRKLIVIMLRGAVDGLNVVVPYGDPDYYRLRNSIAIPPPSDDAGAIMLDKLFGLHPALGCLMPLWQQGQLAFVHAAGSPDPTRSHFDAQDYMESGTPGQKNTGDGWMNRLLSVLPSAPLPTRGISVGGAMPRILRGPAAVTNIPTAASATKASVLDRPGIRDAFAKLYQGDETLAQSYRQAQQAHQEVIGSLQDEMASANNGAPCRTGFPQMPACWPN